MELLLEVVHVAVLFFKIFFISLSDKLIIMKQEWFKEDYKERFKLRNAKLDTRTYSLEEVIAIATELQPTVTKEQVEDIITRELIPPYKHNDNLKVIYVSNIDSLDDGLLEWKNKGWKIFNVKELQ